jgi:hypothetical protein
MDDVEQALAMTAEAGGMEDEDQSWEYACKRLWLMFAKMEA